MSYLGIRKEDGSKIFIRKVKGRIYFQIKKAFLWKGLTYKTSMGAPRKSKVFTKVILGKGIKIMLGS